MFDKMKDLYEMQKQAQALKKALADEMIVVEGWDAQIKLTMSGEMKTISLEIADACYENKARLKEELIKASNKGIETAQQVAAKKMQEMGGFGNMFGGGDSSGQIAA